MIEDREPNYLSFIGVARCAILPLRRFLSIIIVVAMPLAYFPVNELLFAGVCALVFFGEKFVRHLLEGFGRGT